MHRIGIIGTGIIAHAHIKAAREIPGAEITAVSNRTVEKARKFAGEYGIPEGSVYQRYGDMLEKEKLDGVIICLANHLHKEAFAACADAGTAVLLEKPMAHTGADCGAINEKARASCTKLMIGHTQRYNPEYQKAREVVLSGELGKLIMINDVINYNYFWEGRPAWFLDPKECGGGILINYGVHTFDRIQFLSGCRAEKVFAHVDWEQPGVKVDSSYQISALMEDGVSASMTCTGYTGPFCSYTEMVFTKGIMRVFLRSNALDPQGVWVGSNEEDFQALPLEKRDPYVHQLEDFIALLEDRISSPIDGQYGEMIVRQVEASYRSHERGEAVLIEK